MRKNKEALLIFKGLVHLLHIIVHGGANGLTGGKEILGHIHFAGHVFFGYRLTILVGKNKWPDKADRCHFSFGKIGNDNRQGKIKTNRQQYKKSQVKYFLFRHSVQLKCKGKPDANPEIEMKQHFATVLLFCIFVGCNEYKNKLGRIGYRGLIGLCHPLCPVAVVSQQLAAVWY
jgi:hypothetical protein